VNPFEFNDVIRDWASLVLGALAQELEADVPQVVVAAVHVAGVGAGESPATFPIFCILPRSGHDDRLTIIS
jgi:hypothetical protein